MEKIEKKIKNKSSENTFFQRSYAETIKRKYENIEHAERNELHIAVEIGNKGKITNGNEQAGQKDK